MSIYGRVIAHPRPLWWTIVVCLLILLTPFGAALADGLWMELLSQGNWRPFFTAPIVVIYILVVSQWLAKSDSELLKAFRPLVQIEDDAFDKLAREASRIHPGGEVIALLIGALIGLGISLPWLTWMTTFWLRLYVPVSLCLMWGMLAWVIYYSMASTKLVTALHRQPLKVDILDTKPFEPMGRYSLVSSLAFVGGIALGMVFGLDVKNIFAWQSWLINLPLLCVPVIVFFLNMRETHRLLAFEKKRQLQAVTQKIRLASGVMQSRIERDESLGELAVEFTALVAYETRLRVASTWPYNTGMLRTLFFSILVPVLARGISVILFGQ
jgi:uncharacterized membrane protein (UPF0136 family)